jgi:hypothetical protein
VLPVTPPVPIVIEAEAVAKLIYDGNTELFTIVATEIALHIPAQVPNAKT